MYRRNGRYYYGKQMLALGSDLAKAKRLWAEYEYSNPHYTVADLLTKWMDTWSDGPDGLAKNTKKQYRYGVRIAVEQWGTMDAAALTAPYLARYRDEKNTPRSGFNMALVVLKGAYSKAIEWGIVDRNPCDHVAKIKMPVRDRYLEDWEFDAIRNAAPPWLQIAMDLAYATALRPIDVINIRWSDISATHLTFMPQKTKKKSRIVQQYDLTPALNDLLARARQRRIVGLYVVADNNGKRITQDRYQDNWRRVCAALGIENAEFRDIRSKAGTDREEQSEITEAQKLLGHTTQNMTARYMKKGRIMRVEPMQRKKCG